MCVFSRFQNAIILARNNIFSFRKTLLVAAILFYNKQTKSENRPRTPLNPRIPNKNHHLLQEGEWRWSLVYFLRFSLQHFIKNVAPKNGRGFARFFLQKTQKKLKLGIMILGYSKNLAMNIKLVWGLKTQFKSCVIENFPVSITILLSICAYLNVCIMTGSWLSE